MSTKNGQCRETGNIGYTRQIKNEEIKRPTQITKKISNTDPTKYRR